MAETRAAASTLSSPLSRHALQELLAPTATAASVSAPRETAPDMLHQPRRINSSEDEGSENSTPTSSSSSDTRHKCSLAFILAARAPALASASAPQQDQPSTTSVSLRSLPSLPPLRHSLFHPDSAHAISAIATVTPLANSSSLDTIATAMAANSSHTPTGERVKMKRRRTTSSKDITASSLSPSASGSSRDPTATTTGAKKKGSKFCIVEGCSSRAKHARRCWKHGGSVKCKVPDCVNRAKTKGVCWSHGGGTICSFAQCGTISVSNGVCWAHGGGKRCAVEGCSRPAYERTENLCTLHFDDKQKIAMLPQAK